MADGGLIPHDAAVARSIRHRPSAIPHRRAFTLIEVLIVVAIIGIAGAIVVPQMLTAGTMGVQAAARNIIADLLYAQNEAIANQSPRKVIFSIADNSYRVADGSGTTIHVDWKGGDGGNYVIDFAKTTSTFGRVKLVSADFGGETEVTYDALGAPSSGGTVVLQFQEINYRVTVAAFTGRVTVQKFEVHEEE